MYVYTSITEVIFNRFSGDRCDLRAFKKKKKKKQYYNVESFFSGLKSNASCIGIYCNNNHIIIMPVYASRHEFSVFLLGPKHDNNNVYSYAFVPHRTQHEYFIE